jgi:nitric oxide reductase large subunit
MKATRKYFFAVIGLMLLQIAMGVVTAHYAVEGQSFFGLPLAQVLPYVVSRTVHTQVGIFWIATAWLATGLYIAAHFGPGPRDGLMTGLHRRTGRSIRLMRTAVEVAVVITGFVLGGTIGIGTVLYAVSIGPLAQLFLRVFAVPPASDGSTVVATGQPRGAILRP